MLRKIPRTMSTQHPDNANVPSWCEGEVIKGDDEVYEAYFAYSSLGCHEVLWDSEGKDADTRVIRKLLDLKAVEEKLGIKLGPKNLAQKKYENIVSNFLISYIERDDEEAKGYLGEAARLRKCLG